MGYITRREFFKNHAGKKWKDNVIIGSRIAAACVMGFLVQIAYTERTSLLMPLLFPKYEYLAFFAELFALLGLVFGIQFACSRVCAVLLLLYGIVLPVAVTVLEGKVGVVLLIGLVLSFAGVLSLRGAFGLHKEYEKRLRDGTLPVSEASEAEEVPQIGEERRGQRIDGLTRKEFFAQYASVKSIRTVKVLVLSACVLSVISIVVALFDKNDSRLYGGILTIVLAVGVQLFKSRVCAGALLVYALVDAGIGVVSARGLYSGTLFAISLGVTIGIFGLHREWAMFREEGTVLTESERRAQEERQKKADEKSKYLMFLPFGGMFLGMCLVVLFMQPYFADHFTKAANSTAELLQGYINFYTVIVFLVVAALLLPLVGFALAARTGYLKRCSPMTVILSVLILVVSMAGVSLIGIIALKGEDVPALVTQTKEDLAQIEHGELREVTVWISPKSHTAQMPGLPGNDYPKPFTRYAGISDETDGEWVWFYVPNDLGFSLDQSALYNENKSIAWNEENARQYRLSYTDNFKIAVSIEPVL